MRNAKLILVFTYIVLGRSFLMGQYDFISVLPGLSGTALSEQLVQDYKPATVLDFADAKDIMYSEIYESKDSVKCVYTEHQLYLDPGSDPSQYLYLNGSSNGINAEHVYPRSKGAGNGNAMSDLYNLYPTRLQVNADRGNLPFGEIVDAQATFWYYLDDKISNIPVFMIDSYSEINASKFEPREDQKGNIARSVFYFVTMYADAVQAADPVFFEQMRSTLCDWHYADPVDSLEWVRNQKIAAYQSGKVNPFVLDCSLAGRLYCDWIDEACTAVNVETDYSKLSGSQIIYPNPCFDMLTVEIKTPNQLSSIVIFSTLGQEIMKISPTDINFGTHWEKAQTIDLSDLDDGIYFIEFEYKLDNKSLHREQEILLKQKH